MAGKATCAKKSDFGDRELRSTSRFTRLIFHHPSHASQSHPRGIFVPHGGSERIMSVDISWDTITKGPDGAELEARIKDFIHDKFQQVQLPRFIKSVQVHSFAFGSACPEVEIKDVSDPLSDFYEDDESSDDLHAEGEEAQSQAATQPALGDHPSLASQIRSPFSPTVTSSSSVAQELQSRFERGLAARTFDNDPFTEPLPRSSTPGIPGGTSNFSYFHHLPIGGLSGTHTPLAAVASGTPFSPMGWHHDFPHSLPPRLGPSQQVLRDPASHMNRPSTANTLVTSPDPDPTSNPSSPERRPYEYQTVETVSDDPTSDLHSESPPPLRLHQSQPSDLQVVARVQYSGDVRMTLTAEILLDYPMPSFVGIPLKLSITGITFDGVAILAYIRRRMHLCFLDQEDAETLVGDSVTAEQRKEAATGKDKLSSTMNGLIKEIHIESEIGRQENGKQGLKNVGKVEKFVLEQIRRIFEEEFVFPSFWTFLV